MDEREWRLEFYDRYSEDAMIQLGTNDEVKTPKNVIDLIAQDVSEAPESFPVSRAIERVSQKTGFTLSSPRITFFTGSVSFVLNA